jgi:hypothetical protein
MICQRRMYRKLEVLRVSIAPTQNMSVLGAGGRQHHPQACNISTYHDRGFLIAVQLVVTSSELGDDFFNRIYREIKTWFLSRSRHWSSGKRPMYSDPESSGICTERICFLLFFVFWMSAVRSRAGPCFFV